MIRLYPMTQCLVCAESRTLTLFKLRSRSVHICETCATAIAHQQLDYQAEDARQQEVAQRQDLRNMRRAAKLPSPT